jgi:basic membrane protein A and related proteins
MSRRLSFAALIACLVLGAAPTRAADPDNHSRFKAALILMGRVTDPGYFNAGFQALLAVRDAFGAEVSYQENLKTADAEQVLRVLGEEGTKYVIVMGGGNYDDQILSVQADYPGMKFIIVSGAFTQLPNIVSVRTGNPGVPYLAGVLMASLSKTGEIGLIGGRAVPPAIADHVAVIAGALSVRPDIRILDIYTESYDDPALGKEAALAQIDEGADLIFTNSNATSFGVFQAAHERGVLAVGCATDQNAVSPDTVLTSAVYGMDAAVVRLVHLDLDGPGWEKKIYTVDLASVGLTPFHALDPRVPHDVRARLAATRQALIEGRIKIPRTYQGLNREAPHGVPPPAPPRS